jgi:hypothetical protein
LLERRRGTTGQAGSGSYFWTTTKEVKDYFIQKIRSKGKQFSLNETINSLLKEDIEISNKLAD